MPKHLVRSLFVLSIAFLFACNVSIPEEHDTDPSPKKEQPKKEPGVKPKKVEQGAAPKNFTGFFSGKLPCADCPGIATQLWIRSDSTFILGERYIDRDSMAIAHFGKWYVVNGLLAVGSGSDKPEFWKPTAKGLLNVDEDGTEFQVGPKMTLTREGSSTEKKVPVMRLTGAYTFADGSHTFAPCDALREYPLAVANGDLGLEKLWTKRFKKKSGKLYVEIEATIGTAEAQEGDAKDEYVFPKKLIRVLDGNPCQ